MSENNSPDKNADNNAREEFTRGKLASNIAIGGTLANDAKAVTIQPADIYPSSPALVRNVAQQKFADAWRKFWQFPLVYDPQAYAQDETGAGVTVTLQPLTDQRHVIEQVIFSLPDDTANTLIITDGQDTIFSINVSMPTNGGWDYLTFSPCRMQRVANQPMTISLTNAGGAGLCSILVNSWRF